MNGELVHIINLSLSVKYFIKTGNINDLNKDTNYIDSAIYHTHDNTDISSFDSFVAHLTKRKLKDIRPILQNINDISLLGFAGVLSGGTGLIFAFEDGNFIWNASWNFDKNKSRWDIRYKEEKMLPTFGYKDVFNEPIINNEPTFAKTLEEIRTLALTIEEGDFAAVFSDALYILKDEDFPNQEEALRFPTVPEFLPESNRRLLAAAKKAWVFGGICSWVDSPPYQAEDKGLSAQYKELTDRLYSGINQTILYAVNNW